MQSRKLIYLAGPLFSLPEKRENLRICRMLERWCDVFLPQRDGELIPHLVQRGLSQQQAYQTVFERDTAAIRACDALLINLDGRRLMRARRSNLDMPMPWANVVSVIGRTFVFYFPVGRIR